MSNARVRALSVVSALSIALSAGLAGCALGLPEAPYSQLGRPQIADLTSDIECELATIVNQSQLASGETLNSRLSDRIKNSAKGADYTANLLKNMAAYNFVANVQLSLEVNDNESAAPSLSFINTPKVFSFGVGGQFGGTQDRTTTVGYSIDLRRLLDTEKPISKDRLSTWLVSNGICTRAELEKLSTGEFSLSSGAGLAGDLGLADIAVDGLTAVDSTAKRNVYATSGPTLPAPSAKVKYGVDFGYLDSSGKPVAADEKSRVEIPAKTSQFEGILQLAPQMPGVPGSASLVGKFNIVYKNPEKKFVTGSLLANLSGITISPAQSVDPLYFSLSGNLLPVPGDEAGQALYRTFGFGSSVTLVGSVTIADGKYNFSALKVEGSVAASSSSPPSGAQPMNATSSTATTISMKFVDEPEDGTHIQMRIPELIRNGVSQQMLIANFAGKGPSPAPAPTGGAQQATGGGKGGGAAQGGSGGTTFGSLVDFVVVYGASGGPEWNWSYQRYKAPEATGGQLLSYTRTKTDSLSISFVASCQDEVPLVVTPSTYWDSLSVCDELGSAQASSQSLGYQNNSLMILRNSLQQR